LTAYQSVFDFIEELDHSKLSINKQIYEKNMKENHQKYK